MVQFPRTLIEFQDQFPDDAHCWSYLRRARWPQGFECPRCGDCRDGLSRHPGVASRVVPRRLLSRPSQEGDLCPSVPKGRRTRELSDRLDVAAQASVGAVGSSGATANREDRGGRDLHRRLSQGMERAWRRQGGCRRRDREPRPHRRLRAACRDSKSNDGCPDFVRPRCDRAGGDHGSHRCLGGLQSARQNGNRPSCSHTGGTKRTACRGLTRSSGTSRPGCGAPIMESAPSISSAT